MIFKTVIDLQNSFDLLLFPCFHRVAVPHLICYRYHICFFMANVFSLILDAIEEADSFTCLCAVYFCSFYERKSEEAQITQAALLLDNDTYCEWQSKH